MKHQRNNLKRRLLALALWGLAAVCMQAVEVDGINYEVSTATRTATVVALDDGRRYTGHVVIPQWVNTGSRSYQVKRIATHAFYDCGELKSVYLGPLVEEVGFEAFAWCTSLQMVRFGPAVRRVGNDAFLGCVSLEQVLTPSIAAWCSIDFEGGNGRSNPLYYAHQLVVDGIALRNITLDSKITELKPYAFVGCNMGSVTLNNGLERVSMLAFVDCPNLRVLQIPASVTTLESGIQYNASGTSALELIYLGNGLRQVPACAFYACPALQGVFFGSSVTSIGSMAFARATSITELELPASLHTIGVQAFEDCRGLRSLTIGDKVASIGSRAFAGCSSLLCIYMHAPSHQIVYMGTDVFEGVNTERCVLYVPAGEVANYRHMEQFKKFSRIMELGANLRGDLNGDGEVNIADLTSLIQAILNPALVSQRTLQEADVNEDGEIGIPDITALVQLLLE